MTAQWKRQAERAEERQALDELAHADPRGRVRLICGRCGDWEPSDTERTIDAHYAAAHGREEARLVGGFEWMHSAAGVPLDGEEAR